MYHKAHGKSEGEGMEGRHDTEELNGAAPAAQGVILLSIAMAATVLGGFVFHVVAARWLLTADYGRLVLVLSIITWAETFHGAALAGAAKALSEDHRRLHAALTVATKWFLPSGLIVGLILCVAAPLIAAGLADRALVWLLVLAAVEIPLTALLRMATRFSGAMRRYAMSVAISITYALGRTAFGCALIIVGLGALGGVAGQVAGSALAAGLGLYLLMRDHRRLPRVDYSPMLSRSLSWAGYSTVYSIGLATLIAMDMWCVKAVIPDDVQVGLYGAAFALARTPKFLFQAVGGAVFPRVSQALAEGQKKLAASVTEEAFRTLIIMLVPLCLLVGESSTEIITFLFSERYAAASLPLTILIGAISIYAFFQLLLSLIEAADRPGLRMAFAVGLVPIGLALNFVLIPRYGLNGAAVATLITMSVGGMSIMPLVLRYTGARIPYGTTARCVISGFLVYGVATLWEASDWLLIPKLISLGMLYVGLLFVMGELGRREIRSIVAAFPVRSTTFINKHMKKSK